jgi:hypothetical protein
VGDKQHVLEVRVLKLDSDGADLMRCFVNEVAEGDALAGQLVVVWDMTGARDLTYRVVFSQPDVRLLLV